MQNQHSRQKYLSLSAQKPNESPTSPVTIGSTEEEHDGSQPNATEPSEEATPAATIASSSEGDKAQERRTGTVASPDTSAAAFVVEQRGQSEGEHAEETESGTTDKVIDLDNSPEAIPAYPARSPSAGTNAAASDGNKKSNGGHPYGRPLASSSNTSPIHLPAEEKKRRNRWGSSLPAVSAAPPHGVDQTVNPTSVPPARRSRKAGGQWRIPPPT